MREIARRIGRSPSTVSRELTRNAATRGGKLEYRASVAQWKAELVAPKTLSETLRIMAFMCKEQHLDAELFRYFLRARLWENFATRFMKPDQHDAVDLDTLEALLPSPSTATYCYVGVNGAVLSPT